jgi:hypothetical protein
MGSKENLSKGIRFGQGQKFNEKGRPKSLIKQWKERLEAEGYEVPTPSDYDKVALSLLDKTFNELLAIVAAFNEKARQDPTKAQKEIQETHPYFACLIAKELMGKNGFFVAEKIRDRAFGKSKEKVELSGSVQSTTSNFTFEEAYVLKYGEKPTEGQQNEFGDIPE